jgi:uncharacterized protein involved in exopolysaccharide biosynthesis
MQKHVKDALHLLILPLMAGLVFAIASVSWGPRYEAEATLLMTNGPEYDAQATVDDSGDASRWTLERILNTEAEILNADDLKREVIRKIGAHRILDTNPSAGNGWGLRSWLRLLGLLPPALPADLEALHVLRRGLEIKPVKNSGVVHVSFNHANKALSVEILQSLLDGYMALRRSILHVDKAAPLNTELQQQLASYQALMERRQQLAQKNQVGDIEQDTQALNERQSALRTEADWLARELAQTTKQIEIYEAAGSLAPNRLAELHAEKAGQLASAASLEKQLGQIRDERAHLEQVATVYRPIDEELARRKATIGKLNEMIATANLTTMLSKITSPPRLLQGPTASDDPVSLPPLMVAVLAAIAVLVAVVAVRFLERRDEDLEVAIPENASRQHAALPPLASVGADNVVSPELKRKGLGGTRP